MFSIELTSSLIFSIIISALIAWLAGAIWYSPLLGFGKMWMKLTNNYEEKKKFNRKDFIKYVFGLIFLLIVSYGMAVIIDNYILMSIVDIFKLSFFVWVTILLPFLPLNTLYNQRLPWKLLLIDSGYHSVAIFLIAVTLILAK